MNKCACGCGQDVNKKWASGHWARKPFRFRIDGSTGCWVWQGAKAGSKAPYPALTINGRPRYAHRYFYEQTVGPIPAGMQLDHLCGNTLCVNPAHLEPVTNAENTRRGSKTSLTIEDVRAIRAAAGSHREIAARFGVGRSTVGEIRRGVRWADAP